MTSLARQLDLRSAPRSIPYSDVFAPIISAPSDRPFIIAQLGQSLDGRIATLSGASRWINGGPALDHLHRLRAHVDAVVVGAGTVEADNPQLTVRRVAGRPPARVIIDPNGRMPHDARCLNRDGARCLVVRSDYCILPTHVETILVPQSEGKLAPEAIAAALFRSGLKKILIEGGAATVSAFIDAGIVDRIHLLVAPVILGSGTPGLSLNPISSLDDAIRPATHVHVLDGGEVLFDCDLRQRSRG
jgi:riboflavin-specific deaminase-like protein